MNKSEKSLKMAEEKLLKAIELKSSGFNEECLVASYSAMLMAARGLLFSDGVMEKNHYCVILYLKENYLNEIGQGPISWLDVYRSERHQWFYGLDSLSTSEKGSKNAVDRATRFIDIVKVLLKGDESEE